MPYVEKWDFEMIFRSIDTEIIVKLFVTILLEKKILFISKHKSLLSSFSTALVSLIFPFIWMHVYVPLIPDSMKNSLEAPFPYMIGLEA